MRDPKYEISIVGQSGENPILLEENIRTSDAIHRIYDYVNSMNEESKEEPTEEKPVSPLIRRPTRYLSL
jgi:hypothetical protein